MYYTELKIHRKMRSPTRYNNNQTPCPCLNHQHNRRNRIQRLTTSNKQPCINIKRRNKSKIQTTSTSTSRRCISHKRFVLLCSCLYLMSNTQLSVEGNSSSPAEERKYLRSSRGEGTIDNLLTHHTDDMMILEDEEEEEEEEEEFDYEKFHAKHHIPLPALGALGSSFYEQQGVISNNKDNDIGEDEEEEPLLMDESYMVPEEVQAATIPQEVQKNEPPPMGQQQEDSPDSRIDSTTTDTTSDARRRLTVPTLIDEEDSILIDESFIASSTPESIESTTSEVTSHDARRRLTVPSAEEVPVDTTLKNKEQVVPPQPNIKEEEQDLIHKANLNEDKIHEKDRVISNFQEEFQQDKERIATLEEKELHEGDLNEEKLQKKYQDISTLHKQVAQDQLKLQLLKERVKHHQEVQGEEQIRYLPPVTEPSLADDDEEEDDEEFNYESYHTKHHIPLPALGVSTMMGLMQNTGEVTTRDAATLDEEIAHLNEEKQQDRAIFSTLLPRLIDDSAENEIELQHEDKEINELRKKEQQDKARLSELLAKVGQMGGVGSLELQEDDAKISELRKEKEDDKSKYMALLAKLEEKNAPKGLLAFAGTNLAMKNFASYGIIDEGDDDIMDEISTSLSSNIPIMYENTLASISKYRSSLLESNELAEEDIDDNSSSIYDTSTNDMKLLPKEDAESSTDKQTDIASVLADSTSELESTATEVNFTSTSTALTDHSQTTYSNLDRGRHLVGLEVREVQPHQQIIIDYQDIVSDYDYDEHEQSIRPLRIRFLLSDHDDGVDDLKNSKILSHLLDKSFNQTATFWAQALSLPPVMDNIIPTVPNCGGANILEVHRETGVDNADIVVYVSGDNTFCGGSIMHSSICDFDQFMRPLVANINICTNNIPGVSSSTSSSSAVEKETDDTQQSIPTKVLADYNEYILTETSRILGASTSLFQHYHNPDTDTSYGTTETYANCIDGSQESVSLPNVISEDVDTSTGNVYYELRTPRVIEVVRNHFNCMTLTGARMEVKKGGTSCFGGFFDDRIFLGEQVSAFQMIPGEQKKGSGTTISPLTLAILEDSSWYVANYTVSSEMPFGRGAGCQFARDGGGTCAVDDEGTRHVKVSSTHGKGFHCSQKGKLGCDVTHSFKAECDLLHFPTDVASFHSSLPSDGDVCPMHVRGAIDCTQEGAINSIQGEVYGESSKCFLTEEGEAMCLIGTCNEDTQDIAITFEDEVFTCKHDGEIIDTKSGVRIECPRIAAVCPHLICPSNCSGRGVCDEDRDGRQACICDDPFDDTLGCWGQ